MGGRCCFDNLTNYTDMTREQIKAWLKQQVEYRHVPKYLFNQAVIELLYLFSKTR